MTRKDFVLIEDSIKEAVRDFFADSSIVINSQINCNLVEKILRLKLSHAFGNRLRYTADDFNVAKFHENITYMENGKPRPTPK